MDEKELRNRIRSADTKSDFPALNETLVAAAPLAQKKSLPNFRLARLSVAAVAVVALGLGVTLPAALQPEPLFVMASGGSANQSAAMAESSDAALGEASKMIWPGWIEYNYIIDGLSDERGSGIIYEVRRSGDPVDLLERVAAAFGFSGEPKEDEWSTEEFPSYSITGEDFSVNVWWSGPGGWYFSRWSNDWVGCAEPGFDPDATAEEDTSLPACRDGFPEPTPELIPSESEMLEQALALYASLGLNLDGELARVWRDDWGGSVSVPLTLSGNPIPLEVYLGWDSQGRLSYASGYSVEIIERGEFETIAPVDAVDRISDWRWFGGAASQYYEEIYPIGIARDSAVSSEPMPAEGEASDALVATDEPMPLPAPDEYPSEPEIIDVVINRSLQTLLSVYDAAGNMWLVPGYLLYNDQGWFDAIIAVEDGVIQLPEPIEVMPMIDEPVSDTQVEPRG